MEYYKSSFIYEIIVDGVRMYNIVDLFCGCGGFSEGFKLAGFNVVYGLDNWKDATITYKKNFPRLASSMLQIMEFPKEGNELFL